MEQFDASNGAELIKSSGIAKRIQSDLCEEVYAELAELKGLSMLHVSPNLPSDMEAVVSEQTSMYVAAAKKLCAHGVPALSTWQPSTEAKKAAFH
eukprot:8344166-Ditylum_brightwellii.AAC.1